MRSVVGLIILVMWIIGIIVAKGFWWTLASLIPIVGVGVAIHQLLSILGWL